MQQTSTKKFFAGKNYPGLLNLLTTRKHKIMYYLSTTAAALLTLVIVLLVNTLGKQFFKAKLTAMKDFFIKFFEYGPLIIAATFLMFCIWVGWHMKNMKQVDKGGLDHE